MFSIPKVSVVFGLLAINGVIGIRTFEGYYRGRSDPVTEEPLPYEHRIAPDVAEHIRRGVEGPWRILVLLFSDIEHERLRYFDVLAQRYGNSDVRLVNVTDDAAAWTSTFKGRASRSFQVLVDKDLRIHTALHVPSHHDHGGLVILDRDGRVQFWLIPEPPADDLRQLVEKHVRGQVDLDVRPAGLLGQFGVGQPFGELQVTLSDGQTRSKLTDVRNATVVVFGTGCPSCEFDRRLEQVHFVRRHAHASGQRFILLVGADEKHNDLLRNFERLGGIPPSELFSVSGEGSGQDSYWFRYGTADERRPFVIETGPSTQITAIEPLDEHRVTLQNAGGHK